jgi:hypothetical protein
MLGFRVVSAQPTVASYSGASDYLSGRMNCDCTTAAHFFFYLAFHQQMLLRSNISLSTLVILVVSERSISSDMRRRSSSPVRSNISQTNFIKFSAPTGLQMCQDGLK